MTNETNSTAVRNLQRYLTGVSQNDPMISTPPVDGIFDVATARSLREFQRAYGLPETGDADQATWETLFSAYRASLAGSSPPLAVDLFPARPKDYAILPGDFGFLVAVVQYLLREISVDYAFLEDIPLTGTYDEDSVEKVIRFQKENALPADGAIGRLTWNRIADHFNTLFSGYPGI